MRDLDQPGRSAAIAENGMVATSHPAGSLAALDMLRSGGNAVDAALAAVAVLGVVESAMTGVGGDCFVLYSPKRGKPIALNGSGRAPAGADVAWFREQGITEIGQESPHSVTVPGAVDAWCRLQEDYGTRSLSEILAPAIELAENGYRILDRTAFDHANAVARMKSDQYLAERFLPGGKPMPIGTKHSQPQMAKTLRHIAREGRAGFYEGPVMQDIIKRLKELGGLHEEDDFAAQNCEYVDPIHAPFRDHEIYECPPNGQGLGALMIMRVLDCYDLSKGYSYADVIHLISEATKVAYAARDALFCDPKYVDVPVDYLLSTERAKWASDRIDLKRASQFTSWNNFAAEHKDTTYLCVVDRDGNAISFINSVFKSFGSCIMAPESGVILHNRGHSFRLEPEHPNRIEPGKRPMHTIIPAIAMKNGKAVMPFGVMGGHYQSTGHATLLSNMFDFGMDPQQANEAPRHFCFNGELALEPRIPEEVAQELAARGHYVTRTETPHGGCQAIYIDDDRGILIGGSDPRKDGMAIGY
ncbi:MAG: gamma-glutamyltransferase [Rickettsiales bacterium]|nr:gamma-glutamyltransferase [Rickettsiales bacterium]